MEGWTGVVILPWEMKSMEEDSYDGGSSFINKYEPNKDSKP